MKIIQANLGGAPATLEVADNDRDRENGFMFRETCPEHHGILFVYKEDVKIGYTMKNVSIPLSLALLDKNMRIIEVIDMQPGADIYRPSQAYRYAIEMLQGWFDKHCDRSTCVIQLQS
jgi:uncharacterized membrane protein (UPF0127 family)